MSRYARAFNFVELKHEHGHGQEHEHAHIRPLSCLQRRGSARKCGEGKIQKEGYVVGMDVVEGAHVLLETRTLK